MRRKEVDMWRVLDPGLQARSRTQEGKPGSRSALHLKGLELGYSTGHANTWPLNPISVALVNSWKLARMAEVPRARGSVTRRETGEVGRGLIRQGLVDQFKDTCPVVDQCFL